MVIQAFDGQLFCCVNDKDVYALEKIPQRQPYSKDLDMEHKEEKPRKVYIPPMNHPWRRYNLTRFVNPRSTTGMIKTPQLFKGRCRCTDSFFYCLSDIYHAARHLSMAKAAPAVRSTIDRCQEHDTLSQAVKNQISAPETRG